MDVENNFIKPVLLFHFSKGRGEIETHREIAKQYGQYAITLKTVNKWFKIFSKEYNYSVDKGSADSMKKLPDDLLTNYVNGKPNFNMKMLEQRENCSKLTISSRLNHINSFDKKITYHKKGCQKRVTKFTDEFLITLINENPGLNMEELARLADISPTTISRRLKEINSGGEKVEYVSKRAQKGDVDINRSSKIKFNEKFIIDLVNKNPGLNMEELAILAGTVQSTISNWIKKININGERIKYVNKRTKECIQVPNNEPMLKVKPENKAKFTDEFLINLINENPDLNIKELAILADTSAVKISNRISKINSTRDNDHKIILQNNVTNNSQKSRLKFSDEFLINLVNDNPDLNMKELAKIAGTTQATISKRIKQVNMDGERVKYSVKNSNKGVTKFTDEYLINLVNENPDKNMTELAILADTSQANISIRLKQINNNGEKVKYIRKKEKKREKKKDDILIDDFNLNYSFDTNH